MTVERLSARERVGVIALLVALTALMTWPQAAVFATHASEHQDTFFNLWRLRWIGHALLTAPAQLFDGNHFFPERGVLAYSDAILLQGLLAAPLLAAGLPPVLVHNLLLLGGLVASGAGMFVLARHLSGSTGGALAAAVVFMFAPYRFEHYMHMELQWTVPTPWAFWALQRTIESGSRRYGLLTGGLVGLQMLSSIYYGIFLGLLLALVALVQLVALPGRAARRTLAALLLGGLLASAVSAAYAVPYAAASERVGTRGLHEVRMFSARPRDYRVATKENLLYGRWPGLPERRLFPGILPPLLALVGLLLVPAGVPLVAYLIGLAAAFELSLGSNGYLYPLLYEHAPPFRGLRAPARAAVFVLLFLGVLAAHGYAALVRAARPRVRQAAAAAAIAVLLLEYWVAPLPLARYANTPPPLYAWLAAQPKGLVAEFPMPLPNTLPGHDPRYVYMSTFHWLPLLNGYSGYYPRSYIGRLDRLAGFPDDASIEALQSAGVRYVVVHSSGYTAEERQRVISAAARERRLAHVADYHDGWGEGAVFILR